MSWKRDVEQWGRTGTTQAEVLNSIEEGLLERDRFYDALEEIDGLLGLSGSNVGLTPRQAQVIRQIVKQALNK